MNQQNFDILKERIKNTGFPESLEKELKAKMETGEPKIQVKYPTKIGTDEIEATLNFRKSEQNDNYYFNNYQVAMKQENSTTGALKQTFYVGRDNNYAFDEAYNLLNHRFVNKDLVNEVGEKYNGWSRLNFKETDVNGNYKIQSYGQGWRFDLQKALEKFPVIKELSNETDKAKLMDSLKKGNRQEVTLAQDGVEKVGYVITNPYRKVIIVTDENNQRLSMTQTAGQSESQGENKSQGEKENQKQNTEGTTQKNKPRNNKRHRQGIS